MKTIKLMILVCATIILGFTVNAQEIQKEENQELTRANDVEVYYFHFTRRCATCNAVENVSRESVEDLYGDKVKFSAWNLDETEGEEKGDEVGINGQALLIVSGDTKIDITSEGFMNARSNPDKLKMIIKEKIDSLL